MREAGMRIGIAQGLYFRLVLFYLGQYAPLYDHGLGIDAIHACAGEKGRSSLTPRQLDRNPKAGRPPHTLQIRAAHSAFRLERDGRSGSRVAEDRNHPD